MKLILTETVESLGLQGEIVDVKRGFARNYLIPKGYAVLATQANMKRLQNERKIVEASRIRERGMAEELARRIEDVTCTIQAKAGEGDKLYGSVTNMDIAQALEAQGIKVDRRKIVLDEPIKTLGETEVGVRVYPEITANLKVIVVKE